MNSVQKQIIKDIAKLPEKIHGKNPYVYLDGTKEAPVACAVGGLLFTKGLYRESEYSKRLFVKGTVSEALQLAYGISEDEATVYDRDISNANFERKTYKGIANLLKKWWSKPSST